MKYFVTDEQFAELIARAASREHDRKAARVRIAIQQYRDRRAIEQREEVVDELTRPRTILWGGAD